MEESVTFPFSIFKNPGSDVIRELCFKKVKLAMVSRLDLGREMGRWYYLAIIEGIGEI